MLGVVIMVDDSGYGQIIYLVCHAEKFEVLSYRSCLGFRWVIAIFQTTIRIQFKNVGMWTR